MGETNRTWFGVSLEVRYSGKNIQISGYARTDNASARNKEK